MTTKYLVQFLLNFISLIPSYTFLVGCYFLWMQTYRISKGHYWLGQLAMLALLIIDVLFTFFPVYTKGFRPVVNTCLTTWVVYNAWFFWRYPIPWEHLQAPVDSPRPRPAYYPKTKVATILTQVVDKKPFYFTRPFNWLAICFFFLLMCAYFLQKLTTLAVESDKRVVAAQDSARNAVQSVKQEVKQVVSVAVDTLTDNLDKTNARADTAFRKASALERKVDQNASGLSTIERKAKRVEAKADRALNSTILPVAPLQPTKPSGLIPTNKVQSVPTDTRPYRKNKYGFDHEDFEEDSIFYVRRFR